MQNPLRRGAHSVWLIIHPATESGSTLIRRLLRLSIAIACSMLFAASYGSAAELRTDGGPRCHLKLVGDIEEGDAERLAKHLDRLDAHKNFVCLNSGGGSYSEALELISLFLKRGGVAATVVDRGDQCLSACALLFLAGQKHLGDGEFVPFRFMGVDAKVGFHAPYISASGNANSAAVSKIYREGVVAIGRLLALTASDPNREKLFPRDLLGEALQVGPDDFFLLDTVDKLGRWNVRLISDWRPERVTNRMLHSACVNADMWSLFVRPMKDQDYSVDFMGKPLPRETALALSNRRFRTTFAGFGPEASEKCRAELFDHPKFGPFISIDFETATSSRNLLAFGDIDSRWKGDELERYAVGVPSYYLLPASTRLSDLKAR